MAMSPSEKAKAMQIGTALGGQSLESRSDETLQDAALPNEPDRRGRADRGQFVGHQTGNDTGHQAAAEVPADAPKSAGVEERNSASSGEPNDESSRAALEQLLPWRPPGRRGWAYWMMEHAFFGLTRSRSPTRETDASEGDTQVKNCGEDQ